MSYRIDDDENRIQDLTDQINQLEIQTFSPEVVARNESTRNTGVQTGDAAATNAYPQWMPIRDFGAISFVTQEIVLNRVDSHVAKMTIEGNVDFAFSVPPPTNKMMQFILDVTIDATGGYTINLLNNILPVGITINNTANARTVIRFTTTDGGVTYYAEDLTTSGGGGSNVPDPTAEFQHLQSDGANNWIAQQALEFGVNSADSAKINFPNDTIGVAWRNATNDGNLELKGTIAGNLDLTRDDNTAISLSIRSQNAIEVDQLLSFTIGSGAVANVDAIIDTSAAKLKFAVGGANRLTIDVTATTAMTLASPSGITAQSSFAVISTHVSEADQDISMFVGSGNAADAVLSTSANILKVAVGNVSRWQIDINIGNEITQTAFGINPVYDLFRDDTTNNDDIIGTINFSADNSIFDKTIFSSIFTEATTVTDNMENSTLYLAIIDTGLLLPKLTLNTGGMILADGSIRLDEISLPANPPANDGLIYLRDVAGITTPFFLDSAGTETSLIAAAGGGANTALSNLASVAINVSLLPNGDGTLNLGSASLSWLDTFTERLRIETGGASTSTANQIIADGGGMIFNTPAGDRYEFNISGSPNGIAIEEDRIEFLTSGRQHRIDATGSSINILSENITDSVEIWTGAGRTNATIDINSETTTFLTQTSDVQAVLIQLIQNNGTPAVFRTIANIDFMAENSISSNEIYARVSASSQNVTNAVENGLLQLGVVSGGTLVSGIDIEGSGSGGANDALIGFFGESPAVQQQLDSNPSNTEISTALRNLGLVHL